MCPLPPQFQHYHPPSFGYPVALDFWGGSRRLQLGTELVQLINDILLPIVVADNLPGV